jgi:hypothetical protein
LLKGGKNHLAEKCDILGPKPAFLGVCACPKIGVSFILKLRNPIFGTCNKIGRGAFF